MPAICSKRRLLPVYCRCLAAVGMVAVACLGRPSMVQGQEADREVRVFSVTQEDLNNDGRPDVATIDCAFITDRDQVIVYDAAGNMEWSERWQSATDFADDVWVFDAGADGLVELIIDFRQTRNGGVEAWLWDDQDGDGTVRYQPTPNLSIDESRTPNVKVSAPDGWWVRDGQVNFNLDISVDGQIQAGFSTKNWLKQVSTDGVVDATLQVRDTDRDGRPDYQWLDAWPDAPLARAIRRTEITANPTDDETPITGSIFWPYLGSTLDWHSQKIDRASRIPADDLNIIQARSGYTKAYNEGMPPIQMLWDKGALLYVGEFVASRFNDDNWFVYSIHRVRSDEVTNVNFEAPFAFYDLAEDNDGYPELAVRFEQYLARDAFPFRGSNPDPMQIVRYSWDQDNNTAWDYKLGLIGRHSISNIVELGDLRLRMIPPADIPQWVAGNEWDGALFVAAENNERWTSEGIYEWYPYNHWRDEYVTGKSSSRPTRADLGDLSEGQRGEYAFDLLSEPRLYISSVDHRLHLQGAEGGVWKLNESQEIQYANLGGDYLNAWTLSENGTPIRWMYFVSGLVIYADQTGISMTRSGEPAALFTSPPPTDNKSRLDLEQQLESQAPAFAPWDFGSMAAQFGSADLRIHGASIQQLRATGEGFRFVMDLKPGFRATEAFAPAWQGLKPGSYLVTYDGQFHVQPATAPELRISVQVQAAEGALANAPVAVLAEARNSGMQDANGLTLVVQAYRESDSVEIIRQPVDVLSGAPTQVTVDWRPPRAGTWDIESWLESANGDVIVEGGRQSFDVSVGHVSREKILLLSVGGRRDLIPLAVMMLAFAITIVSILWLITRPSSYVASGDD